MKEMTCSDHIKRIKGGELSIQTAQTLYGLIRLINPQLPPVDFSTVNVPGATTTPPVASPAPAPTPSATQGKPGKTGGK